MNESSLYLYGLTKNFRACKLSFNNVWKHQFDLKKKTKTMDSKTEKYDKDKQMKIHILPMFCLHNNIRQNLH